MRWLLVFVLVAAFAHAGSPYQWHLRVPLSMMSHPNVVDQSTHDFGSGVGASILASSKKWLFGPGFGVFGTWPLVTGNQSVRVRPYTFFGEFKWSLLYQFSHRLLSLMPFVSGDARIGATIINRQARLTNSTSVQLNYAFGPSLGAVLWIKNWGLGASYSFRFGQSISHQADIFLAMRIISL